MIKKKCTEEATVQADIIQFYWFQAHYEVNTSYRTYVCHIIHMLYNPCTYKAQFNDFIHWEIIPFYNGPHFYHYLPRREIVLVTNRQKSENELNFHLCQPTLAWNWTLKRNVGCFTQRDLIPRHLIPRHLIPRDLVADTWSPTRTFYPRVWNQKMSWISILVDSTCVSQRQHETEPLKGMWDVLPTEI